MRHTHETVLTFRSGCVAPQHDAPILHSLDPLARLSIPQSRTIDSRPYSADREFSSVGNRFRLGAPLTPLEPNGRGDGDAVLDLSGGCCGLDRPSLALQSPLCRPGAKHRNAGPSRGRRFSAFQVRPGFLGCFEGKWGTLGCAAQGRRDPVFCWLRHHHPDHRPDADPGRPQRPTEQAPSRA